MSEKRRALGRGLGALIPSAPTVEGGARPVDVFFTERRTAEEAAGPAAPEPWTGPVGGETPESQGPERDGPERDGPERDGPSGGRSAGDRPEPASAVSTAGADVPDGGGRGLAPVPGASFAEIPVSSIRPNPRQPRTVFDDEDMAELVHSIREIGVLQPIVVRPAPGGPEDEAAFELVMGERRWRATREAGLETIPAIVKVTDDDDLLRDALLENLHRSELNALEEAAAYQQLLEDFGCTHDELAARIGRSRPQISNTLRLLRLPPHVARRVAAGVLSAGHARALLALEDGAAMERLAQRIVAEGLSVRTVEEIVAVGGDTAPARPRRPRAGTRHPQLDDLAARLSDRFDTRVNIALGQRKGKLTVEFASVDDLHRIVDLLGVAPRG